MFWKGVKDLWKEAGAMKAFLYTTKALLYLYNAREGVLLYAALANDENDVVLDGIGQVDASQLKRTHPTSHFF